MWVGRRLLPLVGALALVVGLATPAAAQSSRATIAGQVPPWATSANFKSATATSDWIGFRVYLGFNNPSAVQSRAEAVSNPKSAQYGQYLTPAQFPGQLRNLQTVPITQLLTQRPQYGSVRLGNHSAGADYLFESRELERPAQ